MQEGYGTFPVRVSVSLHVRVSVCYHSSGNIGCFYAENEVRKEAFLGLPYTSLYTHAFDSVHIPCSFGFLHILLHVLL